MCRLTLACSQPRTENLENQKRKGWISKECSQSGVDATEPRSRGQSSTALTSFLKIKCGLAQSKHANIRKEGFLFCGGKAFLKNPRFGSRLTYPLVRRRVWGRGRADQILVFHQVPIICHAAFERQGGRDLGRVHCGHAGHAVQLQTWKTGLV